MQPTKEEDSACIMDVDSPADEVHSLKKKRIVLCIMEGVLVFYTWDMKMKFAYIKSAFVKHIAIFVCKHQFHISK